MLQYVEDDSMKTKQPKMKSKIVKPQAAATMPSLGAFSPSQSLVSSAPVLVAVGKDIYQSVFMEKFLDVAYLHRTLFLAVFHAFVQLPLLVAHHHFVHLQFVFCFSCCVPNFLYCFVNLLFERPEVHCMRRVSGRSPAEGAAPPARSAII